jgi:hypothetical protein
LSVGHLFDKIYGTEDRDYFTELSSYSADSIQLRYSDEMGKLYEPGSNLVFGSFTGGYGRKVCGSLGFDEENGAVEVQRLNDIGNRAGTTCRGLCSGVFSIASVSSRREDFTTM